LVKWCHPISILPDVGATWIVLESSVVPETIFGGPHVSNLLIVNGEDYVIVGPCQTEQMVVISKILTSVLNVPGKLEAIEVICKRIHHVGLHNLSVTARGGIIHFYCQRILFHNYYLIGTEKAV
jgi:hypothetical protein